MLYSMFHSHFFNEYVTVRSMVQKGQGAIVRRV